MSTRGNAFAPYFGHKAAEVCTVKPNCGARALKEPYELTKNETRRQVGRGICPTCRRAMRLERTADPAKGRAVCRSCGGEGWLFGRNCDAWRRLKVEEQLRGA